MNFVIVIDLWFFNLLKDFSCHIIMSLSLLSVLFSSRFYFGSFYSLNFKSMDALLFHMMGDCYYTFFVACIY